MGLSNNPKCGKCGTEEERSVGILYECEALAHSYISGFLLFGPRGYQEKKYSGHLELC